MIKLANLGTSEDDILYGINLINGRFNIDSEMEMEMIFDFENPDIILIINDEIEKTKELTKEIIMNSNKNQIIIANSDDEKIVQLLGFANSPIITFGLNSKSCITTSSISDKNGMTIQICIQRGFNTITGNKIIEQEFPISLNKYVKEENYFEKCNLIYKVLAITTFLLVNDINIIDINKPLLEYEY